MKVTKNKDCDIHLRLNGDDKLLLDYLACSCGKSTSEYLRILIDTAIASVKYKVLKGVITYEDIKAFCDYQLQFKSVFRK